MQMISPAKKEFIEFMMSADVLRFGEFTTKSGRLSPYFVNTGNYRTGAQIATLGKFYAQCIMDNCGDNFDAMFGPAYKGIPLATSVSGALARNYGIDKPFFFNRKEAKDHGEGGSLVGYKPQDGDRIIIIEDVITAGTAVREVIPKLKAEANVEVIGLVLSVDRMEKTKDSDTSAVKAVEAEFGFPVFAIANVKEIFEAGQRIQNADGTPYVTPEIKAAADAYLEQYGA